MSTVAQTNPDFQTGGAPADVVRSRYLASAGGDLEALRATLAPDVEWTEIVRAVRRHRAHSGRDDRLTA